MSNPKPGPLVLPAWVAEVSAGVVRRPSWIARRLSTRPPTTTAGAGGQPSLPPPTEAREAAVQSPVPPSAGVPDVVAPAPIPLAPPPPASVDLGTSMALAQLAEENAALRTQITEMAATMARLQRDVLEASEDELVRLALTIAERVVGEELTIDPTRVVAWAREAIEALAAKDGVVIAVAKDLREAVSDEAWREVGVEHRVLTDSQLAPGVIEVRTPEGTVTTGVDARLGAVAQALGVGES